MLFTKSSNIWHYNVTEELMSTSCILHLDSHRGYHMEGVEEHIRMYLVHAWISEHPAVTQSSAETIISNMKYIEVKVRCFYDRVLMCVYVCIYIKLI